MQHFWLCHTAVEAAHDAECCVWMGGDVCVCVKATEEKKTQL